MIFVNKEHRHKGERELLCCTVTGIDKYSEPLRLQPGMVEHGCNPDSCEVEDQELEANPGYTRRSCLKNKNEKGKIGLCLEPCDL
jgi:hypothetical protein